MQNRDADAHFESKPHCGNWQKYNLTHNQRTNLHEWSNIVRPKKGHKHGLHLCNFEDGENLRVLATLCAIFKQDGMRLSLYITALSVLKG